MLCNCWSVSYCIVGKILFSVVLQKKCKITVRIQSSRNLFTIRLHKSDIQVFSISDFWKLDFWESSGSYCPRTTAYSACHWLIKKEGKKNPCCSQRGLLIAATIVASKTSIAFSFGQGAATTRGWCGQGWRQLTYCSSGNTVLNLQQAQLNQHNQKGADFPKVTAVVIPVLIPAWVFFCVKVISEACTRFPFLCSSFLENTQVKRGLSTKPNTFSFCIAAAADLNQHCHHHPLSGTWSASCEELVSFLLSSLDSPPAASCHIYL